MTYFDKSNTTLTLLLNDCLVVDNKSFVIPTTTVLFHKSFLLFFSLLTFLILHVQGIIFNTEISHKYFFRPFFSIIFVKNILILSNPDSVTKFKFRSFMTQFTFFRQSKIITMNIFFLPIKQWQLFFYSLTNLFK